MIGVLASNVPIKNKIGSLLNNTHSNPGGLCIKPGNFLNSLVILRLSKQHSNQFQLLWHVSTFCLIAGSSIQAR